MPWRTIVRAIERIPRALARSATEHPLCGRPSVCVSTIHGGVGINTVPERATIEIDRRLGPDENPEAAYEELIQFIRDEADVGQCQVEHDVPFMAIGGLSDKNNRSLAERVTKLVRTPVEAARRWELPYGTDAAVVSATGVPTIVFGPGSIAQAHTADEFIDIDELRFGAEMFHRIASGGLNSV